MKDSWPRRALRFLGIDQAVAFTLAGHLWNAASGPVLLALLVWRLSVNESGVLFNYVSIGQFQVLFELGVGYVIQQLASRERAALAPGPRGTLGGDPEAKARLAALFRIAVFWFSGVMITSIVTLLPVGWHFFSTAPGLEGVRWQPAWVLSVFQAAAHGFSLSVLYFLSGCGDVNPVSRVVATMTIVCSATLGLALLAGAKLLSHPLSGLAGVAVMLGWVVLRRRSLLRDLWSTRRSAAVFSWRRDMWPLQWRMSLSFLSVVAITQVVNPAVLHLQGAEAAGRVGLTLYILMAVQLMGSGWVGTKIPSLGMLAARKNWPELDRVFRHVLTRSTAFVAFFSGLVLLADLALYVLWPGSSLQARAVALFGPEVQNVQRRLLDPAALALLAIGVIAMHVMFTQASYLRAHGREPLLPIYIVLAVMVAVTLLLTGLYSTVFAMIAGYTLWIVILGPGLGGILFLRLRRRWHAPAAEPAPVAALV